MTPEYLTVPLATNELRVSVCLRNNRLLTLREQHGLTQKQLATATGISVMQVARIERFGKVGQSNAWRHAALATAIQKIAAYFGVNANELASAELFEAIKVADIEKEISRHDALSLADYWSLADLHALPAPETASPESTTSSAEERTQLRTTMERTLTEREVAMLDLHFDGHSVDAIGARYNITRETCAKIIRRARQILLRALNHSWHEHLRGHCSIKGCRWPTILKHRPCGATFCYEHVFAGHRCTRP